MFYINYKTDNTFINLIIIKEIGGSVQITTEKLGKLLYFIGNIECT